MTWSPEYSPEWLMLKVKLQLFGHLMWRADSYEKTLMLGLRAGGEGDDREWDGRMASLMQWTWLWASSGSCCKQSDTSERLDWTELNGSVVQLAFWMITTGWYVKGSFTYSPCNLKTMSLFATNEKESSFFPPSLRHICTLWSRKTSSKLRCSSNLCVTCNKSWEMWCVVQGAGALCDAILTLMDRSFSEIMM